MVAVPVQVTFAAACGLAMVGLVAIIRRLDLAVGRARCASKLPTH
jgi:hypothetical protein